MFYYVLLGINFTNTSSPNDTGSIQIMSFDWDLGNGSKSSAINSSGFYIASLITDSIYTIKLTGITEHQCKDSIESLSMKLEITIKKEVLFIGKVEITIKEFH